MTLRHPPPLESLGHVRAKVYGRKLTGGALRAVIGDIAAGRYSELQLAAFVTAFAVDRLDLDETAALTRAMVEAVRMPKRAWSQRVSASEAAILKAEWQTFACVRGTILGLDVVPEVRSDGLGLTEFVVLPHMDLEEFGDGMRSIHPRLTAAGYTCVPLVEAQALVIDGPHHRIVETPPEVDA